MSVLDCVILGFAGLLAVYGYLQGFLVGVLSLAGFAAGAFLGTRLAPLVLHRGDRSPEAPLFGLMGALLLGAVCARGLEGVAGRLRSIVRVPGVGTVDGLLGAIFTGCVGLGIAWIVGAVALANTHSAPVRADIRGSRILRALDEVLPPSGPVIDALSRLDPQPAVHGPRADVAAPTPAVLRDRGVRRAAASVVRVFGSACGLGIEGSGWVVAPGLIVTNAHVVAGERDTRIQVRGVGLGLPVRVVLFDADRDLAVLRAPGLALAPLRMVATPRLGASAAILGYPRDGPFSARAGRLGQTATVDTQNAYGRGHIARSIAALRGVVQPGNSGGPLIDGRGQVLATVFAAITGTSRPGGFAVPDAAVRAAVIRARGRERRVSVGHCAE